MVGRADRSISNLDPTARVNSSPRMASMKRAKAGPKERVGSGKLPTCAMEGKSASIAAMASGLTKRGTITNGKGSRQSCARSKAAMSMGREGLAILGIQFRKRVGTRTKLAFAKTVECHVDLVAICV